MLGASKSAMGAANNAGGVAPPLSGSVSPNTVEQQVSNGSYTSNTFTASAFGGVAPYTYTWSTNNSVFSIIEVAENKVKFSTSGFNTTKITSGRCTITDSNMDEITVSCALVITFGNESGIPL